MLNQVNLIGRLGRKPIRKTTKSDLNLVIIILATTEYKIDSNKSERYEKTEWHRLVLFGQLAETAIQYLDKGDLAYFSGKLQTRAWGAEDQKRYTTEIIVNNMKMLDGKQFEHSQSVMRQPVQQETVALQEDCDLDDEFFGHGIML